MKAERNPFNPNGIVPTNLFAGRAAYCHRLLQKLAETEAGRPASFFLYGERGIGKSALAKVISKAASINEPELYNLEFLPVYYPVAPEQPFNGVLEGVLTKLVESLPAGWVESLKKQLGGFFKDNKVTLGGGVMGNTAEISIERKKEENTLVRDRAISILSNAISSLKKAEEPKDGLLIVVDEIQNLSDEDLLLAASTLRGVISALDFQELGNIAFLLIGLERGFDKFMEGDASARRAFDPIRLDVMPLDEAKQVLVKGFESVGLKWDPAALDKNIYVTGGYPHSIQVVGHNLVHFDEDGNIDTKDWARAIHATAKELRDKEFSDLYSFTGAPTGRDKVLNVLAIFGPLTKKELAQICQEGYGLKNAYQYFGELEKSCAIKILESGQVELHSQLFRTAILPVLIDRLDINAKIFDLLREKHAKLESTKTENPITKAIEKGLVRRDQAWFRF